MKKSKLEFLKYKNYLTTIKKSENSEMFRHIFVLDNNEEKDLLKDGQLSCAYYVSCILKIFNLIDPNISPHATVGGTLKNMKDNGWIRTKELKPGNVLVWEEKQQSNGNLHYHLGFYLGNEKAMSHRDEKRLPIIHHYTYNNERKIVEILTHEIIK